MSQSRTVAVQTGRTSHQARCETCGDSHGDGDVRGWASRHVTRTGHVVYVHMERGSYFRPATLVETEGDAPQ